MVWCGVVWCGADRVTGCAVQEELCPDSGPLQKVRLLTPVGPADMYVAQDSNLTDSDRFNHDFGLQWNMHGVGTFFDR